MDNKRKIWLVLLFLLLIYPAYAYIHQYFKSTSSELTSLDEYSREAASAGTVNPALLPQAAKASVPSVEAPTPPVEAPAPTVEVPAPTVEVPAPTVEATTPPVEATTPTVEATTPTVEATTPTVEATTPTVEATTPPVEEVPLFEKVLPGKEPAVTHDKEDTFLSIVAKKYDETKSCKTVVEEALKEGKDLKKVMKILLKLTKNQCHCINEATQAGEVAGKVDISVLSAVISKALDAPVETDVVVTCCMEGGAEPEDIIVVLRALGLTDYADALLAEDYETPGYRGMPGENERVKGNVSPYRF